MGVVTVTATVSYHYAWYKLIGLLGLSVPSSSLSITRQTQMRYEYQPYNTTNNLCTA
jgi:hypothetical protein